MKLFYIEIRVEGMWYPVGTGHGSREDAEWAMDHWKLISGMSNSELVRVQEHTVADPEPEWLEAVPF